MLLVRDLLLEFSQALTVSVPLYLMDIKWHCKGDLCLWIPRQVWLHQCVHCLKLQVIAWALLHKQICCMRIVLMNKCIKIFTDIAGQSEETCSIERHCY